ncbi:MAG: 5-formyltetrahydrofolate cyclo-ligase [Rhodoluna sp.]|nr:5-formyltetrahydrofolate cyclo-ligase [Rhodoluna sp.]
MTENEQAAAKAELRSALRASRAGRQADSDEAGRLSEQLGQFCIDNKVRTAAAYFPITGEPDIRDFLNWALENGIALILPTVSSNDLRWVAFDGSTAMGQLGFEEATGKTAKLSDADVIFMPALAVDLKGNRLGKGKGYYDRALEPFRGQKRRPKFAAVLFDEEVVMTVAAESHDQPVDLAITASKLIWFNR